MTSSPNGRSPAPARPTPLRSTSIDVRMAALRAAATFCGGKAISNDVGSRDVLAIAAAFERWLLEGRS